MGDVPATESTRSSEGVEFIQFLGDLRLLSPVCSDLKFNDEGPATQSWPRSVLEFYGAVTGAGPGFRWSRCPVEFMIIFDIPYAPLRDGEWSVDVSNGDHPKFKSRQDAIRFAVTSALKVQQQGGDTLIAVEGGDGQWRMFDHRVKGVT